MYHILIIEDNSEINQMERTLLEKNGYEVCSAYSGTEAMLLMERSAFDLVVLDIMLPGLDGEAVLKKIRETADTGVLCVSALDAVETKVKMMRLGADDYITKPFINDEFLVRIESLLRRTAKKTPISDEKKMIQFKELELDEVNYELFVSGQKVVLTRKEFDILELLMKYPRKVFTKDNIYETIWNDEAVPEDNTVSVHISNIRKKIAKVKPDGEYIKTVWGIGFKMAE